MPFGAWREVEELLGVEGPTDRMEPVEMALAATAACVVNSLTYNAARLGIATEGIEVSIRENVDPRVLFALREPEEHVSCLGTVEIEVKVKGEISDEDLATLSGLAEYSPVYGLVAKASVLLSSCQSHQRTSPEEYRSHNREQDFGRCAKWLVLLGREAESLSVSAYWLALA